MQPDKKLNVQEWKRLVRLSRLKLVLQGCGIVVAVIGGMFLPLGAGASQSKRNLFYDLAGAGTFIKVGVLFIALGVTALVLSFFLPGDTDREDAT
jgi:multisubunit Na+/H+ antiporter MnhB subunit